MAKAKKTMQEEWAVEDQFKLSLTPVEIEPVRIQPGVTMGIATKGGTHRTLLKACHLPIPPTVNSIYDTRIVKAKGSYGPKPRFIAIKYTTDVYKAYCKQIHDLMLEKKAWHHSDAPLELCVLVCYRDRRAQDVDNRVKGLQDAVKNGHVFEDDSQVKVLEVREGPIVKGGLVIVTCREITFDPAENLRWIMQR